MANNKHSKKGRTTRRPTKAELERQKAIKRMLVSFAIAFVLLFASLKLGIFGITIYNLIRLLVGSLAYVAIVVAFLYLFFFKWFSKREGLISGFVSIFAGLLLIYQAYFVDVLSLKGQVLSHTMTRIVADLTAFKTSSFAGGGLLGSLLHLPVSFLFSNIGSYFIGLLLIFVGLLLASPWTVYDISENVVASFRHFRERREEKRQQRFLEKEEKVTQAAMQMIELEQNEAEVDVASDEILVDDEKAISLPVEGKYQVLINPYPILPQHLTIVSRRHTPQSLKGRLGDFCKMAMELPDFLLFYNGARCGASAPDHMHFQAGSRGVVPLERDWAQYEGSLERIYPISTEEIVFS